MKQTHYLSTKAQLLMILLVCLVSFVLTCCTATQEPVNGNSAPTYEKEKSPVSASGIGCRNTLSGHIHTEVSDEAVPATCIQEGLTEGSHCGVCGEVLVVQKTVPLTKHQYVQNICQYCGKTKPSENLSFNFDYTSLGYYVSDHGLCSDTDIVIPSVFGKKPVIGIGENAFQRNMELRSIVIPDTVQFINSNAFSGCEHLENVTVPDSVISIGANAFFGCADLQNIDLPKGLTGILQGTFEGSGLRSIVIPEGVQYIGDNAFACCPELISVVIPEGVTYIGANAFANCPKLKTIVLPDSLITICADAFAQTGYYNDTANWEEGVLYIGRHLIGANQLIPESYTIKNDTLTIADEAFYQCCSLKNLIIPDSVRMITKRAFYGCTGLNSIHFTGTKQAWIDLLDEEDLALQIRSCAVHCSDGDIVL